MHQILFVFIEVKVGDRHKTLFTSLKTYWDALCHYLLIQSPLDKCNQKRFLVLMIDTIVMIRGDATLIYRGILA
ncbi:hypothetical protein BSPWISOX_201 [uncultured Gammaproteobacteria bacterium]|nr:hypothetical protein [uncultured Gammaproteobacteria bacterium]VVH57338.1 hypothetical protein BSPCLSOX_108 [uncultured Gammaproteobacteria bacterium]VVH61824.1 hypothetical protein BSPWISOX_201 [uncultured Gammaproteobacteria bacterium]